jgi:hypothetical protein
MALLLVVVLVCGSRYRQVPEASAVSALPKEHSETETTAPGPGSKIPLDGIAHGDLSL